MNKSLALWLFASVFAAGSLAQTGPTRPRFVMSRMPPQFESAVTEAGLRTFIELQIDAAGKVTDVRIIKSSGSADFDERVQKYYRKWRLIPALTADGVPTPSRMRLGHSLRGMGVAEDWDKTTLSPTKGPDVPKDDAEAEPVDPRVFDEPGRVMRMHCKDFLWEYDLLRKISGASAPFELDLMPQTSLFEAAKRAGFPLQDFQKLKSGMNRLLRDAGKTCQSRPDDMYVEQALVPAVKAYLQH